MTKKTTTKIEDCSKEADLLARELAATKSELEEYKKATDSLEQTIAELRKRIGNHQIEVSRYNTQVLDLSTQVYSQANHIKSLEASEKKYVEAAAKLVRVQAEYEHQLTANTDYHRKRYNMSKLVKTAIRTLESAQELAD